MEIIRKGRPKGLPKTGGRQKGTPNKTNESCEEFATSLLMENRDKFRHELLNLSGTEFCDKYIELLSFIVPELYSLNVTEEGIMTRMCELMEKTIEKVDRMLSELTRVEAVTTGTE